MADLPKDANDSSHSPVTIVALCSYKPAGKCQLRPHLCWSSKQLAGRAELLTCY